MNEDEAMDWFELSCHVAEEWGFLPVEQESFAVNITNYMMGESVLVTDPNSYLKEPSLRERVGVIFREAEDEEEFFRRTIEFYRDNVKDYEKKIIPVRAHVPCDVYDHINSVGVVDYINVQVPLYLRNKSVKLEPYGEHKTKHRKECGFSFLLSPSEYELFKRVDGESFSNKLMNLYVHELERNRQKLRRIEILNTYFPERH